MSGQMIRDTGVVLRTVKLGEADRIVTILTINNGKVKGVAKGARKSGSKYSARLDVSSVVDFQWISSNRELVRLTQTDTVFSNRNLRENLDLLNATAKMLDAVDVICEHDSSHQDLALMTIRALTTMNERGSPNVCGAFLVKLLSIEGFSPETASCPSCSRREMLRYFSVQHAAFFCEECRNASMLNTLEYTRESIKAILDGRLVAVLDEMTPELAMEIESIAVALIEHHVGYPLRSLRV